MIRTGYWQFFAQWLPEYAGHKLAILVEEEGVRSIVTKIELKELPRYGTTPGVDNQPIPMDQVEGFLQAAMDAAWELGLRPTGFKDHTNELTAVRYHLEDMRLLAKVRKLD